MKLDLYDITLTYESGARCHIYVAASSMTAAENVVRNAEHHINRIEQIKLEGEVLVEDREAWR